MKEIRIGDRVKFLNETDTGVVVEILDRDMVLVRTDADEFEYPVLRTELLVKSEESLEDVEATEAVEAVEAVEADKVDKVEKVDRVEKVDKVEKVDRVEKVDKVEKVRKSGIEEVDLHIREIIDDTSGMSSGEIVEVQLARFRTALEGAVRAKQKKIIFIHGKGAGKLKYEIQKIISNEYKNCRYQDASFKEYGYGATLILIN